MTSSPTETVQISRTFATPIGAYRVPDAQALNLALGQFVLSAEQRSVSAGRSNIGGWRSHHDLFDDDQAAVATLRGHMLHAVLEMVRPTLGQQGFRGQVKISAWANVLRRGNYNTPHNHPDSAWSGVYYVDVGTQLEADAPSGLLEFMDPRPQVEMAPSPGRPFGAPIRVRPEAGLMVLFPSWLYHFVHSYTGDAPRISIAFNAAMAQGEPSARG